MEQLLSGAVALGALVAGLFFFRFWHQTRDTFFIYFALAFWVEAGNRVVLGTLLWADERAPVFYTVRLVSYALILVAIWKKNRRTR
jgi:hypothetical protein